MKTKHCIAGFLGAVFLVGGLLVPIIHRAHCADAHDSHNADQCQICQLASAAVTVTSSHVGPVAEALVLWSIDLPPSLTTPVPPGDSAQARGPPAA